MSNGIDRAYSSFFSAPLPPARASDVAKRAAGTVEEETSTYQAAAVDAVEVTNGGPVSRAAEAEADGSPPAPQIVANVSQQASGGFFGEDGFSFRDVLDAINPLNHIPIVSGILEDATGHKVSTGSKLMGGLMGGPIGFAASLVNVIFEQQTGKGVAETVVAALSGPDGASSQPVQIASAQGVDAGEEEQLVVAADAIEVSSLPDAPGAKAAPIKVAFNDADKQRALLDLYGGSVPSAHRSYQKAQMRGYLNEVTHSQVL